MALPMDTPQNYRDFSGLGGDTQMAQGNTHGLFQEQRFRSVPARIGRVETRL